MRRFLLLSGIGVLLLIIALVSCERIVPDETANVSVSSSSSSSQMSSEEPGEPVIVTGTIQPLTVGIFMQGTHRLTMEDGQSVLLESDTVMLDDYVGANVRVEGDARPTVEGNAVIVRVDAVTRLEEDTPQVLEESSSVSSVSSVASVSSATMSSVRSSSSAISSVRSSSSVASSSSLASSAPMSDRSVEISAMAKASADTSKFTTQYCSTHIGFCMMMHRNWYYQSFGVNVPPSLWHLEVGTKEIVDVGDGIITIDLVTGAMTGADGVAVAEGELIVVSKQWTGGRHFEISAPAELKAAAEFMAGTLVTYEAPQAQ